MAALLVVGLALRLGWALTRPVNDAAIDQLPDQREYLQIAQNLRAGEGLCFTDPRFNDRVYAYRTPGYPLLIAAFRANVRIVRVAQCLLDTSTILAAYLLARKWLTAGRATFAAAIVALNPFLVYFCALLLSETLFTAMLAWGMLLLTNRRTIGWLAGGAVIALSILVRPGAIGLPILLGVIGVMVNRSPTEAYQRKWPLPVGTTMLVLTLAALLPWAYRNYRVLGEWVWTSTNGGITRYDGFNPDATGASDQSFVATMPHLRGMSETARDAYLAEQARNYVRDKPLQSLRLAAAKIARTWSPMPLSSEFSKPLYIAAAVAFAVPFDLLVIAGLVSGRLTRAAKVFLMMPAVYLTLAAACSVGSLRYRIPAEVPMAIVAAAGLPAARKTQLQPLE